MSRGGVGSGGCGAATELGGQRSQLHCECVAPDDEDVVVGQQLPSRVGRHEALRGDDDQTYFPIPPATSIDVPVR